MCVTKSRAIINTYQLRLRLAVQIIIRFKVTHQVHKVTRVRAER